MLVEFPNTVATSPFGPRNHDGTATESGVNENPSPVRICSMPLTGAAVATEDPSAPSVGAAASVGATDAAALPAGVAAASPTAAACAAWPAAR